MKLKSPPTIVLAAVLATALVAAAGGPAHAQKTDLITMRNGDIMTGEVKWLDSGRLDVSTDAMSTVHIKWPRILTLTTDKRFEIVLEDEQVFFGSLRSAEAGRVVIVTDDGDLEVPTQRVVRLHRLKSGFWSSLDGNVGLGVGYTQQNDKTDFNFNGDIKYPHKVNLTRLQFENTFSRQNGTDDIFRLDGTLAHLRQFSGRWFYLGIALGSRNSQLSLVYRAGLGGGVGRLFIETNRAGLAVWLGPAVTSEQYNGQESALSIPLALVTNFQVFIWESLNTELQGKVSILPILNEGGRWRIDASLNLRRELVSDLFLGIGINELYDSKPPSVEAATNDFSFTTTLGFKF